MRFKSRAGRVGGGGSSSGGKNGGTNAAGGHETFPKLYSERPSFDAGIPSAEYSTDLTSLQLR